MNTDNQANHNAADNAALLLNKITQHLQGLIYQFRLHPDKKISMPYASEHLVDMFGLSPDQVKEDASLLLAKIHPQDYPNFRATSLASAEQLTTWHCEFRIVVNQHQVKWLYGRSSPELEADGSVLWTGYLKEITELKHFKELALMSSVAMQASTDSVSDLLFEVDETGFCQIVHTASDEMFSSVAHVLIGKHVQDFLPNNAVEAVAQGIQQVVASGNRYQHQFSVAMLQGTRWFDLSVVKNTANLETYLLIVHIRDVTDYKATQDKLSVDTVAFQSISQGVVISDTRERVLAINQAFTKITGFEEQDILGKSCRLLQGVETSPDALRAIKKALNDKQEYRGEILNYRKNGSTFWNEITITPVLDPQGNIKNFVGVMRDITSQKIAQEKLAKMQKTLVETNDRYIDLYEFAPVGYLSLDEHGMVVEANWKARAMLNIKRKELGKERFSKSVDEEHKKYWAQQFSVLKEMPPGSECEFELKITHEDQPTIDLGLSCIRIEPTSAAAIIRLTLNDISQIKHAEAELRKREYYQRSLLDNFPFMVWLKDKQGRFLSVNKAYLDNCGAESLDEMTGKTDLDFWPPNLAQSYIADDREVMHSGKPKAIDEVIEVNGQQRWFETYKSPVIANDKIIGTVGFARDISDRKRAINYEQFRSKMLELVVREQDAQLILDSITRGIEHLNPTMFCLIALIDQSGKKLKIASAPSLPKFFIEALHGMKIAMGNGSIGTTCFTKQRVIVEDVSIHPYWTKNRELANKAGIGSSWAEPIVGAKGNILGAFGIYQHYPQTPNAFDITLIEQSARLISIAIERDESVQKIEYLAYYDEVTGLTNRRYLLEQLRRSMALNAQTNTHSALFYLDIDQFKTINDAHGHDTGDMLLIEVSKRLKPCLRVADTLARVGGDEFAVLLDGLHEQPIEAAKQAESIANQILAVLGKPYVLAKHKHHSSASIGITMFGGASIELEDLLKQADIAMYQAKRSGRNTFRFFDPKTQANISSLLALEIALRSALSKHQFQLYYQVQVDHLGQPFGAEALLRWKHPERGLVSPAEFIPLAEETGLIVPMGAWVIETACAQIRAWQQDVMTKELTLSVNISAKQFRQAGFVEQVQASIAKYGIDPMFLRLELTESILLENVDEAVQYMDALGKIGVQFSLDDFGTGYSSLQYLKKLPLYQLKIDQSFVRDIVTDSHDRTIVRTIIAMAQSMYIGVIAEGVETQEQKELLLTNGCRRYQGYFFGKPMPIEAFNQLIKKNMAA